MIADQPITGDGPSADRVWRRRQIDFAVGYGLLVATLLVVVTAMTRFPAPFGPAVLVLMMLIGLAVVRPAAALGLVIVLAVVGDPVSMGWWPVTKNLSSGESILFVSNALPIKPLDIVLGVVVLAALVNRRLSSDPPPLRAGPLGRPMAIFGIAVLVGLAWGLGRGGDLRAAFFEVTPLVIIPFAYLAVTNLFTSLDHYRRLLFGIVAAQTVEAIWALSRLEEIKAYVGEDQSAFEHTAANHMNLAMLLVVAIGWFGAGGRIPRLPFLLAVIPIGWLALDGERRAGVVALIVGGIVLSFVLSARNRHKFLRTIPSYTVVALLYTGIFWGASSSQIGFPAQAIRSVIAPSAADEVDSLSDQYREIESYDLNFTIRTNPVLGVGFGQPFYEVYPLPDISGAFEFADYIAHNWLLWIWLKTGVVGFIAFVYANVLATALGLRAAIRIRDPGDATVVSVLVAFVPMAMVVAYVEISSDPTNTLLWGVALAVAANAERLESASRQETEDDEPSDRLEDGIPILN